MKTFLSKTIVMWYKRLGFAGAARWRLLYWTYKIWPGLHIRHKEWDWVLEYLPTLGKWQNVTVFDVGSTSSLFIYETMRRGYITIGSDIKDYQEKIKPTLMYVFIKHDITTDPRRIMARYNPFDFITCISVLEHIPCEKQADAVKNMLTLLKTGGRLLLTIPTKEYAQGHPWSGFTYNLITEAILNKKDGHILEYTERAGQICVVIGKT